MSLKNWERAFGYIQLLAQLTMIIRMWVEEAEAKLPTGHQRQVWIMERIHNHMKIAGYNESYWRSIKPALAKTVKEEVGAQHAAGYFNHRRLDTGFIQFAQSMKLRGPKRDLLAQVTQVEFSFVELKNQLAPLRFHEKLNLLENYMDFKGYRDPGLVHMLTALRKSKHDRCKRKVVPANYGRVIRLMRDPKADCAEIACYLKGCSREVLVDYAKARLEVAAPNDPVIQMIIGILR